MRQDKRGGPLAQSGGPFVVRAAPEPALARAGGPRPQPRQRRGVC